MIASSIRAPLISLFSVSLKVNDSIWVYPGTLITSPGMSLILSTYSVSQEKNSVDKKSSISVFKNIPV